MSLPPDGTGPWAPGQDPLLPPEAPGNPFRRKLPQPLAAVGLLAAGALLGVLLLGGLPFGGALSGLTFSGRLLPTEALLHTTATNPAEAAAVALGGAEPGIPVVTGAGPEPPPGSTPGGTNELGPTATRGPASAHAPPGPERREHGEIEPSCYLGVVLPHEAVDVVAETEGRVQEILVRPGDRVAEGDILARLHNPALGHRLTVEQGTLALVEAEVQSFAVQKTQAERSHQRRLGLGGLVSRQDLESSAATVELARYRLDVAYAELVQANARVAQLEGELARLELRAPFDGTVGLRYLDRGATVRTGTPVVRLVGRSTPRVRFAVPPAEADALPLGLPVRLELEGLGLAAAGTLTQHPPEIDAASGLVFAEAVLEPDETTAIPPGAVVRVSRADAPTSCTGRLPAS